MKEIKQTVCGEEVVTGTTAEYLLLKVRKMYDFVKCMGENLSILRFFHVVNQMTEIAKEIDEKGLLDDEQMFDVWELIIMFDDSVQNDMPIGYAREYLKMRLNSIIRVLQGEKIIIRA